MQEDDGHYAKYLAEPEYVGDWMCGPCARWKPVYMTDCEKCGNSKNIGCSRIFQPGPGKKVRPDVYFNHRNEGFC